LWEHPVEHYLPADIPLRSIQRSTLFGGLYQLLILER
jgi:hypothetical protein